MLIIPLTCTKCRAPLTQQQFEAKYATNCRSCGSVVRGQVYPAFLHDLPPSTLGQEIDGEDQASCFHHPTLKAEMACDYCGRFLCCLCDIAFTDKHVCPACMERMAMDEHAEQFTRSATNWEVVAFYTSLCLVLGPLAIVFYILGRRTQKVAPRLRPLGLVGLILGIVETVSLCLIFLLIAAR